MAVAAGSWEFNMLLGVGLIDELLSDIVVLITSFSSLALAPAAAAAAVLRSVSKPLKCQ